MALTGQLSDMSLAELIEFFCNQRKTGRLKVDYHRGHGVFFIKEGELVDAKVGQLSGSEAVYFALTLPNAAFDFSPEVQPTRRTITESWTQVVLEGLRRLDEGLSPTEADAFGGWAPSEADMALFMDQVDRLGEEKQRRESKAAAAESEPFSMMVEEAGKSGGGRKKMMVMGAAACIVLAVVVAAIPLMRAKPSAGAAAQAASSKPEDSSSEGASVSTPAPEAAPAVEVTATEADVTAAQREQREREQRLREQRERERRADEAAKKAEDATGATPAAAPAATGPKSVRVSITYDEAGRVTAASVAGASPGAEAFAGNAVRIARGKRFPAGKAGSTVVTIPVN